MVDVSNSGTYVEAADSAVATGAAVQPPVTSKWYRWRRGGVALMRYLLDSEVHTYAFSVAANAIISFIPFIVLLYTLSRSVFHSQMMVHVVGEMVHYFLPSNQDWVAASLANAAAREGVQWISLVMILISCTGIFLPLEVALNQAWGVTKSRNYVMNQLVAFGLAILMVVLAMGSIFLSTWQRQLLGFLFFEHTDNFVFEGISYLWLAISTGVASILFFLSHLLAAAQSQDSLEACSAHVDCDGSGLAACEECLCGCTSAPRPEGDLWAVLCFGGVALLGVCVGVDPVCRRAIQRGAVWEREEVELTE